MLEKRLSDALNISGSGIPEVVITVLPFSSLRTSRQRRVVKAVVVCKINSGVHKDIGVTKT